MTSEEDPTFFTTQIAQPNAEQPEGVNLVQSPQACTEVQPEPEEKNQQNSHSLKQLLMAFNNYDKEEKGLIQFDNAKQIFISKGLDENKATQFYPLSLPQFQKMTSFDEFLFIYNLTQHSSTIFSQQSQLCTQVDQRLIDFLKLLNNYRKKSEKNGNYKEAKNSKTKVQEIRQRELARRNKYLKMIAEKEYIDTELKQKKKFEEFCIKWDKFMNDYEDTAAELLLKVREKQVAEMSSFEDQERQKLGQKMHYSKYIIELQTKQKKLVKVQQYELAAKVKQEIEQIKAREERDKQIADHEVLQRRLKNFKKQQEATLNTLLQKIQKDRNDHLKQRQTETEKMMVRNKTTLTLIEHRYNQNVKKVYEALHNLSLDRPKKQN